MTKVRSLLLLSVLFIATCALGNTSARMGDQSMTVPLGGNAWRMDKDTIGGSVGNNGIVNWSSKRAEFVVYVRLAKTGNFKLWLNAQVPGGQSTLVVSALKDSRQVIVRDSKFQDHFVGEWTVKDTGYIAIKIKALSKTGNVF